MHWTLTKCDAWLVPWLTLFALLCWGVWGKIEQPIIDVGRELEIPARLLTGEILYRDIGTYYGPLPYYVNAAVLFIFGCWLKVFYFIGFSLSLIAASLFYLLGKRLMNARWAALVTMCFLIYCAMGSHYSNFVLPYSYGAVHATIFSLLAFILFDNYTRRIDLRWLVAAATSCGMAILSKQEFGLAALGGILLGINLFSLQSFRNKIIHSFLSLIACGTVVCLSLCLLSLYAGWENILFWLLPLSKYHVLNDSGILDVSLLTTIRRWSGSFRTSLSILLVMIISIIVGNRASRLSFLSKSRTKGSVAVQLFITVSCCFFGVFLLTRSPLRVFIDDMFEAQPLRDLSWSFPFIVFSMLLHFSRESRLGKGLLLWVLLVFSVILNARWLFNISFFYSLYAPSIVLIFFTLLYELEERTGIRLWRYVLVLILIGGMTKYLPNDLRCGSLMKYQYAVSSTRGTFYTKDAPLANAFNDALAVIRASNTKSVLVIPEGVILNFLSGTHSPSRELTFIPGILPDAIDEKRFIQYMQGKRPELIVYVDVPFYFLKNEKFKEFRRYNTHVHKWITEENQLITAIPISPAYLPWNEGVIRIYRPYPRQRPAAHVSEPWFRKTRGFTSVPIPIWGFPIVSGEGKELKMYFTARSLRKTESSCAVEPASRNSS